MRMGNIERANCISCGAISGFRGEVSPARGYDRCTRVHVYTSLTDAWRGGGHE